MISIIDYGVGNLKSLQNALKFLGVASRFITTPGEVETADKMILPGVGAFDYAISNIRKLDLEKSLIQAADKKTPTLGICLGMQLFFTQSEEGEASGLNLIPGKVKRFDGALKVPHMGWNEITFRHSSILTQNPPESRYGYFVHSYYCEPEDSNTIVATTDYGIEFVSAVQRDHIFGVQFHPEKSQELGLQILKNFTEY